MRTMIRAFPVNRLRSRIHGSDMVHEVQEASSHKDGKANRSGLDKAPDRRHEDVPQAHGLQALSGHDFAFDHNGVVNDFLCPVIFNDNGLRDKPSQDSDNDQD